MGTLFLACILEWPDWGKVKDGWNSLEGMGKTERLEAEAVKSSVGKSQVKLFLFFLKKKMGMV